MGIWRTVVSPVSNCNTIVGASSHFELFSLSLESVSKSSEAWLGKGKALFLSNCISVAGKVIESGHGKQANLNSQSRQFKATEANQAGE